MLLNNIFVRITFLFFLSTYIICTFVDQEKLPFSNFLCTLECYARKHQSSMLLRETSNETRSFSTLWLLIKRSIFGRILQSDKNILLQMSRIHSAFKFCCDLPHLNAFYKKGAYIGYFSHISNPAIGHKHSMRRNGRYLGSTQLHPMHKYLFYVYSDNAQDLPSVQKMRQHLFEVGLNYQTLIDYELMGIEVCSDEKTRKIRHDQTDQLIEQLYRQYLNRIFSTVKHTDLLLETGLFRNHTFTTIEPYLIDLPVADPRQPFVVVKRVFVAAGQLIKPFQSLYMYQLVLKYKYNHLIWDIPSSLARATQYMFIVWVASLVNNNLPFEHHSGSDAPFILEYTIIDQIIKYQRMNQPPVLHNSSLVFTLDRHAHIKKFLAMVKHPGNLLKDEEKDKKFIKLNDIFVKYMIDHLLERRLEKLEKGIHMVIQQADWPIKNSHV